MVVSPASYFKNECVAKAVNNKDEMTAVTVLSLLFIAADIIR